MRIVGGRLRGRVLKSPSSSHIRPTSDRLRETMFDILTHKQAIENMHVLDLFAGTGALGIEALSRGALKGMFVDHHPEARALLRANVEALALGGVTRIGRADATDLGRAPRGARFDLVFLDPPYAQGLAGPCLASLVRGEWLAENALIVVEEAAAAEVFVPEGLYCQEKRLYGDTQVCFLTLMP